MQREALADARREQQHVQSNAQTEDLQQSPALRISSCFLQIYVCKTLGVPHKRHRGNAEEGLVLHAAPAWGHNRRACFDFMQIMYAVGPYTLLNSLTRMWRSGALLVCRQRSAGGCRRRTPRSWTWRRPTAWSTLA